MTTRTDWAVWSKFDDGWMAVDHGDPDYCREGAARRNASGDQHGVAAEFAAAPAGQPDCVTNARSVPVNPRARTGSARRRSVGSATHTARNQASGAGYAAGCRCEECRAINSEKVRVEVERRAAERVEIDGRMVHPTLRRHGVTGYRSYMCRCEVCTAANSAAGVDWYRRRAASAALEV